MFFQTSSGEPTNPVEEGRKQELLNELKYFQTNDIPLNEFQDFLKQKCGSKYDINVLSQLMELACDQNQMININAFIDEFIDTENTLTYRMEVLRNRIHDIKMEKDGLRQKIQQDKIQKQNIPGQSRLIVQVIGATNLELAKGFQDVKSYVKVQCGNEAFYSKMINDRNPKWSESFDFQINESFDSNQKLFIEVYDQNRGNKQDKDIQTYYGHISFFLSELKKSNSKDINENLLRIDSIKMQAKIQVKIKYIHSQETVQQNDEKILIDEIKKLEIEYRDNENALDALSGIFKNYSPPLGQYKQKQYSLKNDQSPSSLDDQYVLSVHPLEIQITQFLDNQEIIQDWNKLYLRVTVVFITICLITSLYRNMLFDLTTGGILVLLVFLNELTQKRLRIIALSFVLQMILEAIWISIYHINWVKVPYETTGEQHLKHYTIIMTYLVYLVRIPFTILTWKNSAYFTDLEIMMDRYSNILT